MKRAGETCIISWHIQAIILSIISYALKWFDCINLRFSSSPFNRIVWIKLWEKFGN